MVGRGAAKSMYGSCLQSFFLNVNSATTYQVTTAPTMLQAEEIMAPIRTSITRARGPLYKFFTEGSLQNTTGSKMNRCKLASTKKGIENFLTGSLLQVRPMSVDKLQGLRVKCATIDEWLSGDTREDVIGAIEQGAAKEQSSLGTNDYLIVAMSSEGTVRNGVGDTIKMELMDILKGEYYNPHVSIWWYKLDSVDEVGNPEMWVKANPNIGKTVKYETYNAKEFVERWAMENGPMGIEKVPQGVKTESVPLGELKKLAEERMLLFDEEIMTFTMGNCITMEDTNGNRKLFKKRYEHKIDAVAALMDAYIAYKETKSFGHSRRNNKLGQAGPYYTAALCY
ncbi:MAG: terminase large subunit [Clostridiales bacterium]|nr:terminase large subunit [Clostridiales bacterium]